MSVVDSNLVDTKLMELNLVLSPEINYQLETMFPKLDGMFANRAIKQKFQLVKRVEPLLKEMLFENEEVLFISRGIQSSSSMIEGIIMNASWSASLNHTVIVLTRLRLLCIRSHRNGTPRQSCSSIYYSQIKSLKSTIFGNAKICLQDGVTLVFKGFPEVDRKTMRDVFLDAYQLFEEKRFDPEVSKSCESLCGHCFEVVPKNDYECESCGATFWKPLEIGIRSFVFPSWGEFVMRHYFIACIELFSFMLSLLFSLVALFFGNYIVAILIYFITNIANAAKTAHIATKDLHLKKVPEKV